MNILITGYTGFIGRNLAERLLLNSTHKLLLAGRNTPEAELTGYLAECDFVFHLAAVHRPDEEAAFEQVNVQYFGRLLHILREKGNRCPVLLTSSVQAGPGTAYGRSKLAAEALLEAHCGLTGAAGLVYRLTNTFGRYARPNAHSVVATFCYKSSRNLPVTVHKREAELRLLYIDDVIDDFAAHAGIPAEAGFRFYALPDDKTAVITVGYLADKILHFNDALTQRRAPELANAFERRLYATFLSYV